MENLLFLSVPILRHVTVCIWKVHELNNRDETCTSVFTENTCGERLEQEGDPEVIV